MKVVIIGTGNTATVLGKMLLQAGNNILQVYGRNVSHAEELARALQSGSCSSWSAINRQADLYLVAITDKALYELEEHLELAEQVVVHTAGSVSKEVLKKVTKNYGVLYPLQSLRKEIPVLTKIPLLIDAANEYTLKKNLELARQISANVTLADDESRFKLHLAAVCVNNFANHLYQIAEDFCGKENIDFNLLLPLTEETARRLELVSPAQALTGPAIRNDLGTINKHLDMLKSYPLFHHLYEQMTYSIRKFNKLTDS